MTTPRINFKQKVRELSGIPYKKIRQSSDRDLLGQENATLVHLQEKGDHFSGLVALRPPDSYTKEGIPIWNNPSAENFRIMHGIFPFFSIKEDSWIQRTDPWEHIAIKNVVLTPEMIAIKERRSW